MQFCSCSFFSLHFALSLWSNHDAWEKRDVIHISTLSAFSFFTVNKDVRVNTIKRTFSLTKRKLFSRANHGAHGRWMSIGEHWVAKEYTLFDRIQPANR